MEGGDIDDIVEGIVRLIPLTPKSTGAPYKIYNIGNNKPENLKDLVSAIEHETGLRAQINLLPMQPGDVKSTYADNQRLREAVGFTPATALEDGLARYARWFKSHYGYA